MPSVDEDGDITGWVILCPACQSGHKFNGGGGFNGNKSLPTFAEAGFIEGDDEHHRCHFTVDGGRITFFPDCSHPFRGMTLELPVFGAKPDGE